MAWLCGIEDGDMSKVASGLTVWGSRSYRRAGPAVPPLTISQGDTWLSELPWASICVISHAWRRMLSARWLGKHVIPETWEWRGWDTGSLVQWRVNLNHSGREARGGFGTTHFHWRAHETCLLFLQEEESGVEQGKEHSFCVHQPWQSESVRNLGPFLDSLRSAWGNWRNNQYEVLSLQAWSEPWMLQVM